jgi:hypothetical protein
VEPIYPSHKLLFVLIFFRYIAFAMHLDIVSTCIAKFMYLQKGKRIVIWDGGGIFQATIHAYVITFILL